MTLRVLAPGGDGIGPEVIDASISLQNVATKSIALGGEDDVKRKRPRIPALLQV